MSLGNAWKTTEMHDRGDIIDKNVSINDQVHMDCEFIVFSQQKNEFQILDYGLKSCCRKEIKFLVVKISHWWNTYTEAEIASDPAWNHLGIEQLTQECAEPYVQLRMKKVHGPLHVIIPFFRDKA